MKEQRQAEREIMTKRAKIFYCYEPKDEAFLVDLETRLKPLERSGQIDTWGEHNTRAGANREHEIEKHLRESDIVLLLVSPDFLASDHCQMIQQQAIELHEAKKNYSVIPIILRPVEWKHDPISKLKSLPQNEVPISRWKNKDEALLDVGVGIKEVVDTLLSEPQKQFGMRKGFMFIGHYPADGYRWDNDLRPAPGLVKQESMPDAPWLVSQAVGILEIHQRYSIFEEKNVLRDFTELSPTAEAIKKFADRHGHLGPLVPLYYPDKVGLPDSILWRGEALQYWLEEIEEMNFLVTLWEMIQNRQIETLKEHIIWTLDSIGVHFIWKGCYGERIALIASKEISPELLYQWGWGEVIRPALHYLCTMINTRLEGHINPTLFPSRKDEIYLIPDCLRSALYMLLLMEVRDHSIEPE